MADKEEISGRAYLHVSSLTENQRETVQSGMAACLAFWQASQELPTWKIVDARPHHRCVQSAMAIVDILRKSGKVDANVYKVGLRIALLDRSTGKPVQGVIIGNPHATFPESKWNAHLVVRVGDFLFDPTLIQTKRVWNDLPHFAAFDILKVQGHKTRVVAEIDAPTVAFAKTKLQSHQLEISYFSIPTDNMFEQRPHDARSDAKFEIRRDAVRRAVKLLNGGLSFDLDAAKADLVAL